MRQFPLALYHCSLLLMGLASKGLAEDLHATNLTHASIGLPVEVTAGQEFYEETQTESVPAYRLDRPFKSSMPGSMGFRFGFAIDTDVLVKAIRSPSGWEYFVPPDHKFRAYHSLLGSVIRGGDAVGLRIGPKGQMEWFVDNSVYAKMPTMWTRQVNSEDPALKRINLSIKMPTGESVERLIYLGVTETNHARIRLEKITQSGTTRDEFTFPLDNNGNGDGAINGSQFSIHASSIRATITVSKAMASEVGEN